ncbi:MAG: hypothetical protein ABJC63_05895 [Gemmatimonadales bacterium]
MDMEAGLEHLSRGTGRHLSKFIATIEPYYRSMEVASRVTALARELGIEDVVTVSTKVRNDADRKAIADFCTAHSMVLAAEIPYDAGLIEAERNGQTPIDFDPASPAVKAIESLADLLLKSE